MEKLNKITTLGDEKTEGSYIHIQELGAFIKKERRKQNITVQQLADLAGVSLQTIINLHKSKLTMRIDTLLKILKVLGKDLYIK